MKKIIAFALALVMILAVLASCGVKDDKKSSETSETPATRDLGGGGRTETDGPKSAETESESAADSVTESDTETQQVRIPINSDEYTGVPYSGPADLSVLSKAVIIGDSRAKGLPLYTSISSSGARVYANEGLSVPKIKTDAFVQIGDNTVTVLDALSADPDYDSVYFSLGINEIGIDIAYIDSWLNKFADVIESVREINPDAQIYVQAILPVTKEKSDSHDYFNKPQIDGFNARLLELAKEHEVNFLNTDEMFVEFDGYLPEEGDAGDGIHINKAYTEKWLTYILEHRA